MHLSGLTGGRSMTHEEFRNEIKKSKEQGHRKLFENYSSYVYTIVYSRLRNCVGREDIEECVSDVFAEIFLYYDSEGDFSGSLNGFVGTVARRKAADMYKKHVSKKYVSVSLEDEDTRELDSGTDVEKDMADKELRKTMLNIIEELGEPDSVILMQKYYFGRSSHEIAEFVSLSPSAVRVRCGRAVKRLRNMFEKAGITL